MTQIILSLFYGILHSLQGKGLQTYGSRNDGNERKGNGRTLYIMQPKISFTYLINVPNLRVLQVQILQTFVQIKNLIVRLLRDSDRRYHYSIHFTDFLLQFNLLSVP